MSIYIYTIFLKKKSKLGASQRHKFEIGQFVRLATACHCSFKNIKPNYLTKHPDDLSKRRLKGKLETEREAGQLEL
jgi:hypothetical protein